MAVLPAHPFAKSPPFEIIGTDLTGPLMVTLGQRRVKKYVCIFKCLAIRAAHLEIIPSLDVNRFLQAYRRL